jgi:transcription antitermination factor NusG
MAFWGCVQLQPQRERYALHHLTEILGFEIYCPRIAPPRAARQKDPRLLFPGYCFLLVVLQWHSAKWAPGVVRLVLDGGTPAKVPDSIITDLKNRERGGLVRLPERKLKRGDKVRVITGAMAGLEGLYHGQAPRERVEILLQILGSAQRVNLPAAGIEAF